MRYLDGSEEQEAWSYVVVAAMIARDSTCLRSKCGSVIVTDGLVIGKGFNSPPQKTTLEECLKDKIPMNFKSDRTCCVHAEQRAVMDALRYNADKINGSRLYFIRLDQGGKPMPAGEPYCTICSKMTLDAGVSEFVLWHSDGICVYDTKEYNDLSFLYRKTESERQRE